MPKFAVTVFPGSNCDHDAEYALGTVLGQPVDIVWHDRTSLAGYDVVIVPGGFAHGDHLRTGAIARFSPVMNAVIKHAKAGKPVIGICNGFQILCETGLLPGVLVRNLSLKFVCQQVRVRVENTDTPFTRLCRPGQVLRMPIAHGEGRFTFGPSDLKKLERNGQVVFRYCDENGETTDAANPNGAMNSIAGITNEAGNVVGLMPHPERASEDLMGSSDGRIIFESVIATLSAGRPLSRV
jgi:phosphoribosylformylglycinamidine synthase